MPRPIEVLSKESFWSRMAQKAAANRVPYEVMIELTYGCNLRCVHCFNPTHQAKGELTTAQAMAILDQLAEVGCLSVGFTGGEIFTRPDLLEIVAYAKRKGFVITLLTNATLLTPQRADRIQALHPAYVEVSIYGATPETYERVTRVPGSFEHFLTGVGLLRERAIPLIIKMPVMTLNQHEVKQAKALVEGWGIKFVYCSDIHPRVDGSLEPLQYRLTPEDVIRIDDVVLGSERSSAAGGTKKEGSCPRPPSGQLFTCNCGTNSLAVTPYGRMNLCVALPTPGYDLLNGTVAEGWRRLVEFVDEANARPGPAYECPTCALHDHCRQGPMDAWLATGRLEVCLPHFKELATLEQHVMEPVRPEQDGPAAGTLSPGRTEPS